MRSLSGWIGRCWLWVTTSGCDWYLWQLSMFSFWEQVMLRKGQHAWSVESKT